MTVSQIFRRLNPTGDQTVLVAFFSAFLAMSCLRAAAPTHDPRQSLSVEDIERVLGDEDWVLVDTRQTDAFNGWKLDGVKRGGHLPGSVDFPASWLDSEREDKSKHLLAALKTKGIEKHRHIVLCSTNQEDRNRVADYLSELGFDQLYDFDINKWASDEKRPLTRYDNFHLLVPAQVVKQLLDGRRPETFESATRIKFIEVSWGKENASYLNGHVPQSIHINTDDFEPPPAWMLGGPELLKKFALQHGIQADDTAILSGEDPTASYRLAIVLRYMGVRDVRVLNGGFAAWKAAKYPVETSSSKPVPVDDFGAMIPVQRQLIVGMQEVKNGLRTPDSFTLVDTRTWAEYTGKWSGYSYHSHKGKIPGSTYGQGKFTGKNSLTPYRNIDNTMRNADEILDLWKRSGIDRGKHLSFMCGSGWRAAEVLTFANVMGLDNTSLYSDGWIGWSNFHNSNASHSPQ